MAVDSRRTKVERTNSAITSLDVYGRNGSEEKRVRRLYLTPEGDVRGELFYNAEDRPVTEIQRYDFRELRGHAGSYDSVIFPKKITILSPETKKGSAIFFTRVTALDTIDPLDFILRVPPKTKEVFLDEKDPRYQHSKTASAATGFTPVSSAKAMPVYLAKSREVPVEKITPPPAQKETKKPEARESAAPVLPASVDVSVNTDAAMAAEDRPRAEPSSASNARTTLDPSVEASLEMGKQ
jgi:hypothetical protein